MATASEEFLIRLRYWLVSGGMMTRIACGTDDQPQRRTGAQAERIGRLRLPVRHGENAGAHDFGDEGGGIDREAEQQRGEFRQDFHAAGDIETARVREIEAERPPGDQEREQRQPTSRRERHGHDRRLRAGSLLPPARPGRRARLRAPARATNARRPRQSPAATSGARQKQAAIVEKDAARTVEAAPASPAAI